MTRVERAEIYRCELPLEEEYPLSDVLGTLTTGVPVVLRLVTEDGTVGYGEADPLLPFTRHSPASLARLLADGVGRIFDGVEVENLNDVCRRTAATFGSDNHMAMAAVDVACHDLLGKSLGVPVHELLGGKLVDGLDILKPLGNDSPESNAETVAREVEDGFTSFMLKTGRFSIETDLERVAAIRDRVGDSVQLIVDANGGWTHRQGREFARKVRDYDVKFLEQPVPGNDASGLVRVANRSPVPISADESLHSVDDAERLLQNGGVDVFSIKITKNGGIRSAEKIMDIAARHHVDCFMNSMIETGVTQAASLQLAVTRSNLVDVGHAFMSPLRLGRTITDYSETVVHGNRAVAPESPGLGVSVDREALSEMAVETFEVTIE